MTITAEDRTRANHCAQAQAGYWYCEATPDDPCGPGRHPHDGHVPGQCATGGLHLIGRTILARFQPDDRSFARPENWVGISIRTTDRWEVLSISDTGAAIVRQVAAPHTVASIYPGQYRTA